LHIVVTNVENFSNFSQKYAVRETVVMLYKILYNKSLYYCASMDSENELYVLSVHWSQWSASFHCRLSNWAIAHL